MKNHITLDIPINVIKRLYTKVSANEKIAFFSAIACGLLAHLYHFTNKQFNSDEIGFTPSGVGGGIDLGRWGLALLENLINRVFGTYSLPLFSGFLTLLLVAFSAYLVVKLFDVEDCVLAGLIGALFTTFPALTSIYFFMFTAPPYAVSLLLSIWSSYIFLKKKRTILNVSIAILLLTLAIGIYQAYFAVSVSIILIQLILWCMNEKRVTWRQFIKKTIDDLLYLIIALSLYFIVHKIVLSVSEMSMVTHRGLDQMGTHGIVAYLQTALLCYKDWLNILRYEYHGINPTSISRVSLAFMMIADAIYIFKIVLIKKSNILSGILILILTAMMPIACFLARVMSYPSDIYSLMIYSSIFILIFPIILCNKETKIDWGSLWQNNIKVGLNWIVTLAACICILIYIWYANGNYMQLQYTNYRDLAYYETIVTQIKDLDGFHDDLPLMLKGSTLNDTSMYHDYTMELQFNADGKTSTNILSWCHENLISDFLGYQPRLVWDFQISDVIEHVDEFETYVADMPYYPDDGSIQIVEGIIVVKFSD